MRMMWQLRQTGVPGVRNTRVLLYGGGLNATLYLNYVSGCATSENMSFIGIVDDDPALAGMRVFGLPVLGSSADLERILARYSIDKTVLTVRRTSPEREVHVLSIAERAGVSLCRFQAEELRIGDFRVE